MDDVIIFATSSGSITYLMTLKVFWIHKIKSSLKYKIRV